MTTRYWNISYLIMVAALALGVAYVFGNYSYDIQGGVLVFMALCLVAFLVIKKMAKGEDGSWFLIVLVLSFFLKLLAGLVRINTNESLYGGQYDAGRYHSTGMEVAEQLWSGDLTLVAELTKLEGSWGTRYTEFYSGLVHTMTGPTIYGAFLVFSFLAFIGLYFYYRAFCIAFPHGNRKLYALLVFLLPSLIFWPNGLGKDALMALFIGLTAYGAAQVFAGEYLKSLLPLGIGLLGALTVRPHMIGIAAVAMMAGLILGSRRFVSTSPVLYVVVMAVIFMGALYLVPLGA